MDQEFWRGRKVFVTGHTGFKGSWLCLWLAEMGARVTGYALAPDSRPNLFEAAGVEARLERHLVADVRDGARLDAALRESGAEVVLHLAAQALVRPSYKDPVTTYETNVMGTVRLLEAARRAPEARAVVVVTSDKCYENREWVWGYRENEAMGGHDPYSSSKGCAELVASAYERSFFADGSARVATARAGNVLGGGDWSLDRLVPDCLAAWSAGRRVTLRYPHSTRPWQHALDPLRGYLTLARSLAVGGKARGGGWNFGPPEEGSRTVAEVVATLAKHWGPGAEWELDPAAHPHEARGLALDCSKARAELGWRPVWNLDRTLGATVEWQRDYVRDPAGAGASCLRQIAAFARDAEALG